MNDKDYFRYLGINKNNLNRGARAPEIYYKAVIDPVHPHLGGPVFQATQEGKALYFGSAETFSLIAHHREDANNIIEIMSFIIDNELPDGEHDIGGLGSNVQGLITMTPNIIYAKAGKIKFQRNDANGSITANFHFDFEFEDQGQVKKYSVKEGKLSLVATGPLEARKRS
ncbi:hypothetical protein [Pseudomonas helmanticensis]|uniref:hypothetical protein n=1 Tax=Pseudomonas helmanticensis TaxID=1471381 RepID=UPI0037F98EFB